MSLKELSEQKKAELQYKWTCNIRKQIESAQNTKVIVIDTGMYPSSRMNELNTEAGIITSILNELKGRESIRSFEVEQTKIMGWTEWKYLIKFKITLT